MAKKKSNQAVSPPGGGIPPHIPDYPAGRATYIRLYADMLSIPDPSPFVSKWRKLTIPPTAKTELGVYRLVPSAPDFEYGGWITKRCIFYAMGEPHKAYSHNSTRTSFHSHPSDHPYADTPSPVDVYQLLKWPTVRRVIKGRFYITVLEKTTQTLAVVSQLFQWEAENMVSAAGSLCRGGPDWADSCCELALQRLLETRGIGIDEYFSNWLDVLRKSLKIRVRRLRLKSV